MPINPLENVVRLLRLRRELEQASTEQLVQHLLIGVSVVILTIALGAALGLGLALGICIPIFTVLTIISVPISILLSRKLSLNSKKKNLLSEDIDRLGLIEDIFRDEIAKISALPISTASKEKMIKEAHQRRSKVLALTGRDD